MGRSELASTFTKLALWSQTQFRRIIYLDADTMVLRNLDHLFDLPKDVTFAAAPELGFPDTFNSGMMALTPSKAIFNDLEDLAARGETLDGGDQGVLSIYYSQKGKGQSWHRLSFLYNLELYKKSRLNMPAVQYYRAKLSVVHFIGKAKPWTLTAEDLEGDGSAYSISYKEMVEMWWGSEEKVDRASRKEMLKEEDSGVAFET